MDESSLFKGSCLQNEQLNAMYKKIQNWENREKKSLIESIKIQITIKRTKKNEEEISSKKDNKKRVI